MPNWKKLIVSGSSAHLYNLNVASAVTASYFVGDGSGLTNVNANVSDVATVSDTFTNVTSKVVTHNFGSKNVIIGIYDSNDNQVIPETVNLTDNNSVTITFSTATTGTVVVAKGGHIVSGSAQDANNLGGEAPSYYLDYTNFTNIPATSYRQSIEGSGPFTITHNLSEDFPVVQVYNVTKEQVIPAKVTSSSSNAVVIEFSAYISGSVVVSK
jgi:hypothetical protein